MRKRLKGLLRHIALDMVLGPTDNQLLNLKMNKSEEVAMVPTRGALWLRDL